jgi:hypothetical protein
MSKLYYREGEKKVAGNFHREGRKYAKKVCEREAMPSRSSKNFAIFAPSR